MAATADWLRTIKAVKDGLPATPTRQFSLVHVLGDPILIDDWKIHGLPADQFSIDSAVIMKNASKPPLFIDPQTSASRWIRSHEKSNGLRPLRLTDADYSRVLEGAVSSGVPVLCESLGEVLDPTLVTLVSGRTFDDPRDNGKRCIRLGDQVVEYHDGFRLYMATSMPNPSLSSRGDFTRHSHQLHRDIRGARAASTLGARRE